MVDPRQHSDRLSDTSTTPESGAVGRYASLYSSTALSGWLGYVPAVLIGAGLLGSSSAYANPDGGSVIAGSATFETPSPDRLNVIQSSDKAIIDWRSTG